MATWRIYCKKKNGLILAVSSFKEILWNLRKFYLRFKEMCEIGSESPVQKGVFERGTKTERGGGLTTKITV